MNKNKILSITLLCFFSALFLVSSIILTQAAPGDRGVDVVIEGVQDFRETGITKIESQIVNTSELILDTSSYTSDFKLKVTDVNTTLEWIQFLILNTVGATPCDSFNVSSGPIYVSSSFCKDDDNDGLFESFWIEVFGGVAISPCHIIAGTWTEFTEPLDAVSQELIWLKGNVSTFDYELEVNDVSQTIAFSVSYQQEDYFWFDNGVDVFNESVIYDVSQEYMLDYEDFIINRYERVYQISINEIVNQTYLNENEESFDYSYYNKRVLQSSSGSTNAAIPGYELYIVLGICLVSVLTVFSTVYITKRRNSLK